MRTFSIAFAIVLMGQPAHASCSASMMNIHLEEARTSLRRISSASDLEDAQSYVRRFRSAADSLEMEVMSCNCWAAQSEFSDASSRAHRAQNASNAEDFFTNIKRAARAVSDGVEAYNSCVSSR